MNYNKDEAIGIIADYDFFKAYNDNKVEKYIKDKMVSLIGSHYSIEQPNFELVYKAPGQTDKIPAK